MLAAQSPLSSHRMTPWPKSSRKPLQPKNALATPITPPAKPNPNPEWIKLSLIDNSNKENIDVPPLYAAPPVKVDSFRVESLDASLAEELSAIRAKLERLRMDKENTEKMLKERDLVLDMKMKELFQRGQVQKQLEIEMDRLYRLNEIRLSCTRKSPLRSLREKEREHNTKERQMKGNKREEIESESPLQSPNSEQSMEEENLS